MKLFRKFIVIPGHDKFLFIIALGLSLFIKVIVFTIPLRWYSRLLGQSDQKLQEKNNNNQKTIQAIARAVNRSSRYAPWKSKCLVDAITAKLLLRWHGISSIMFLGVTKEEGEKLVAHAWLKCGETFITGKRGYRKFTVVSSFV